MPLGARGSARRVIRSHRGRYQFHSPSIVITDGNSTARTTVASINTAIASPTPSCLNTTAVSVAKIENTATITIAALVTTPAVALIPTPTASAVGRPRTCSSRMRLRIRRSFP